MKNPKPGDLVKIVDMPDQSHFEKSLRGKLGIVIENITAHSSPNIWKILIDDKCCNLHLFDFIIVQEAKKGIV
jgi:hypothetical protein